MKRLFFILSGFLSVVINAQTLTVSSDKNPAIVGEQILLQYSINTEAEDFKSPNFNGLQVLSGPNPSTQSSYTFVNGKSQSSISTTYSFYLIARKAGTYTINPASINVEGKTINSKPFTLNIVEAKEKNKLEKEKIKSNLFIKVNVNKKNIVIGEQIMVTYSLYTRLELQNTEITSLPSLNGFWTKDLKTSSQFNRKIIEGLAYNVAIIKKSVLTAQKSGQLEIDPIKLRCNIRMQNRQNNRDPFANFFGRNYQIQEQEIESKPIYISVREIPDQPANYNGAVGKLNITSEVDNKTINANEAINYKITIAGTGNIELIKPLKLQFPEEFEVYEPKVSEKIFEGGLKRSTKTFDYLLIPRYQGTYNIPSANIIVYNPEDKTFKTKKTKRHQLIIKKNLNNESDYSNNNQKIVQQEQKDINYISTKTKLKTIGTNIIPKLIFYLLFLTPIIILILLLIYEKIAKAKGINSIEQKNKKANKIAQKRLKIAQKCINTDDFDHFFEEIEKSLWGYFADKFKVNPAELSKQTITNYFSHSKIDNQIQKEFIHILNECEFARYAPKNNKNTQMDIILKKAKKIIIDVETALK